MMFPRVAFTALLFAFILEAQPGCPATPAYSPCDLIFDLNDAEAAAHPDPYLTVDLEIEFRSPHYKTFLMPAFWDGGRRMVVRFAPIEAGQWTYRINSNIDRFKGQIGNFTATESDSPGFVHPANVHHWATENKKPHLWMGDTCYRFGVIDRASFEQIVNARAAQKFSHISGLLLGWEGEQAKAMPAPDRPNTDYFRELDNRLRYMNAKGIVADLILGAANNALADLLPTWQQRQRFVRYIVARYSAFNITWQGIQEFEGYTDGRALLKEIGLLIKKLDPYNHARSTSTRATSAPLLSDGWMNYVTYQSSDDALGAIEHQLYPASFVNAGFGNEDSGAGKNGPDPVEANTLRHRLWNARMDGQYPNFSNTGTYGGKDSAAPNARFADSPGAKQMTVWYDFFDDTRYWELEPYFDVDGGRAIALEGVEYVVYLERPGSVSLNVEKHGYEVEWVNPIDGERTKVKKGFKGDQFEGEPPDTAHDWVLHIVREGEVRSLARSVRALDSRENGIQMQEPEANPQKVPFEIVEPDGTEMSASKPVRFSTKLKRETRATRAMQYLWTAEVATEGQGYRVLASGPQGAFQIPAGLARKLPAVLSIRVAALNALGKVYLVDRVFSLVP